MIRFFFKPSEGTRNHMLCAVQGRASPLARTLYHKECSGGCEIEEAGGCVRRRRRRRKGVMTEEVGKAELLAGSGLIRVVCGLVQQNTEVAEKL